MSEEDIVTSSSTAATLLSQPSLGMGVGAGADSRPNRVRKVKAMDLEGLDFADEPRKKKKKVSLAQTRSLPQTSVALSSPSLLSASAAAYLKKPRGRPPLSGKKSSLSSLSSLPLAAPLFSERLEPVPAPRTTPRPPFKSVAKKVFGRLAVAEPLSLEELSRRLPEVPPDMLATALEVLAVLGVAEQRERLGDHALVFALKDFAKLPTAVAIEKLEDEIAKRAEETHKTQQRIEQIHVSYYVRVCVCTLSCL